MNKPRQELSEEQLARMIGYLTVPLKPFRLIQHKDCKMFQMMKEYGSKVAPLNVIGTFLNLAGNHMLNYIVNDIIKKDISKKKEGDNQSAPQIFFPEHKVISITLLKNGDFLTTAQTKS